MFLQIYREVLHPLHHEEAECSSEAQDDHEQELPHQQEVTAVEERQSCENRLTTHNRFHLVVKLILKKILLQHWTTSIDCRKQSKAYPPPPPPVASIRSCIP